MTKRISKKKWERLHAQKRAEQRYGFSYNRKILSEIKQKIKKNKTFIIEKQSLKNSLRIVKINDAYLKFVWDNKRKEVVTFLPLKKKDLLLIEDIKNRKNGKSSIKIEEPTPCCDKPDRLDELDEITTEPTLDVKAESLFDNFMKQENMEKET